MNTAFPKHHECIISGVSAHTGLPLLSYDDHQSTVFNQSRGPNSRTCVLVGYFEFNGVPDIIIYFMLYHLGCRYFVCFEFIGVADEAVLPDPLQPPLDHTSIRKCKSVGKVNQFKWVDKVQNIVEYCLSVLLVYFQFHFHFQCIHCVADDRPLAWILTSISAHSYVEGSLTWF